MREHPISDLTAGQTDASIASYLRTCEVGSDVAIRETHFSNLRFTLATVESINAKLSRLYTVTLGDLGRCAWFMNHAKSCAQPKGQTRLVEPTAAIKAFAQRFPRGASDWPSSTKIYEIP